MRKTLLSLLLLLCVGVQAATFFPSRTDFRDESIYFVITTRFYDGDSDNNVQCWDGNNPGDPAWRGDFKGLIEKMDYIKALGFTAIWMTPIVENASGYDYHGYHAHDFSKVDHRYESEGVGFQQVIDEAHKRGMKIILDIVLNHTGNFGEANLCKEFTRDADADQSDINACMIPYTQKDGGRLPDNYASLPSGQQYDARLALMKNTDGKNHDTHNLWHHYGNFNWDDPNRWFAQIAGDCVDLNTENPAVYNYLIQCYGRFIKMGVDGFRIDTGGHIARLSFNKAFIPAFEDIANSAEAKQKRGNTPFYMFAEICARYTQILYRDQACLSPFYYTWAERKNYAWDDDAASWDNIVALEGDGCATHTNHKSCWAQAKDDGGGLSTQPTSQNALLNGNTYHTPDYSQASGLHVIDFPMHWMFTDMAGAFGIAQPANDQYYNDATWNVVYVDSHDYAPDNAPQDKRYSKGTTAWAENLDLMFTYRGIPCLYYGSEVEFKKGCEIDKGTLIPLQNSGRAYYGGYIKGSATVTDFAEYTGATGNMAATLSQPLSLHIRRLNRIRMAVPALRKGQYSVSNISKNGAVAAFKRRYTDATTDSYALVCISGGATFSNIENGTYVDCITGDTKTVSDGTLTATCSGKGNMRVYVLSTAKTPAPGKIGADGKFLYATSPATTTAPAWDGTQEELTDDPTSPSDPTTPIAPCLTTADQRRVFFHRSSDFGTGINCYIWHTGAGSTVQVAGAWPGQRATSLGNDNYYFDLPEDAATPDNTWKIIWNDGSGNQTPDLTFHLRGYYTGDNKSSIAYTSEITAICSDETRIDTPREADLVRKVLRNGRLYLLLPDGSAYDATGRPAEW